MENSNATGDYTRVVLDTSIIIDGKANAMVSSGEIKSGSTIIVPIAALDELQAQASRHREEGFLGLEELTRLRALCDERKITLEFRGERPSLEDIQLARSGRIDAIIRDVAKDNDAILFTADYVQSLVGRAQGVRVRHFPSEVKTAGLKFEEYIDEKILSLHLKEGVRPYAKRGYPGKFEYVPIRDYTIGRDELEAITKEISEAARISSKGSVEISRSGATVIQLGPYRVAIARPPFSDGLEVTIVRPLVRLSLADYNLSEKLEQRLASKAEGILIAGPPGSGKSTLASSLADFYLERMKVVKTFESPKDLQVSKGVTQYGPLENDFEKTAEILLLVRPDYTIFDEVRKTKDFEVFADMRLAGVGMVGVVHASDPVNAVQRFMSRMELGMVPHVVDTVIFVKDGKIKQVLELNLVVKVPSGMNEPDLARPVVEVKDFESGKLEYEIYTFGEENVIIPIGEAGTGRVAGVQSGVEKLAQERILQVFKKFDPRSTVKIQSPSRAEVIMEDSVIPRVIGRGGEQIRELEERLSIHIDVKPRSKERRSTLAGEREEKEEKEETNPSGPTEKPIDFEYIEKGNSVEFLFNAEDAGKQVRLYSDHEVLLETNLGRKARIKFSKKSEMGKMILRAVREGEGIKAAEY
ncbi:MAG TPA: PINc/VapC family ATPase [Nitrososphaerales archaeon]|nr:PINc/VapC family ATPase [Nitrososphaerales archaeon]